MKAWEVTCDDIDQTWHVAAETQHDACAEALKMLGWQVSAQPRPDKFVCSGCGIVCDISDHARAEDEVCDNCTEKELEAPPTSEEDE